MVCWWRLGFRCAMNCNNFSDQRKSHVGPYKPPCTHNKENHDDASDFGGNANQQLENDSTYDWYVGETWLNQEDPNLC